MAAAIRSKIARPDVTPNTRSEGLAFLGFMGFEVLPSAGCEKAVHGPVGGLGLTEDQPDPPVVGRNQVLPPEGGRLGPAA